MPADPEPLLTALTDAQRAAVTHLNGPLLVLAGPGSGKTRVVTHRIAYLLSQGIPSRQIVALTFTNKAADEMRSRLDSLVPGHRVWLSTFHRFCAHLLRNYGSYVGLAENFTIYDTYDSRKALGRTLDVMCPEGKFTPEQVGSAISWAKNQMVTPAEFEPRRGIPVDRIVAEVYPAYQARLLASSAVDFDDLLLHVALLLRDNAELRTLLDDRYRYILVDEYQDTNRVQYAIVRQLSIDYPNLQVTGDPDQSIYGWRGANLNNILDFDRDYEEVQVVKLEQNYRSTQRILAVADGLIVHNRRRKPKDLFTVNEQGAPVRLAIYRSGDEEAESIAGRILADCQAGRRRPCDFAIFYRTNALSRVFENAFREVGIPYQVVNGLEFYQRKEIKDILAYLLLVNNPRDDVAFERTVNTPPRGIGRRTVERLADFAASRRLPLLEAARSCGLVPELSKRAATLVLKFVGIIDRLQSHAHGPVEELLRHVATESGYGEWLAASGLEEDADRLANIEELISDARTFDEENPGAGGLESFLQQKALVNDTDAWDSDSDRVSLMTLHSAKGLEFPVVFIVACEQGLLPHERSTDNEAELEEERRLLFVGITRAQEELQISCTSRREYRGQERYCVPSSFLMEIPRGALEAAQVENLTALGVGVIPVPYGGGRNLRGSGAALSGAGRVATAAEMLANESPISNAERACDGDRPGLSLDELQPGMAVLHPEFHLGKIIAIVGVGAECRVTVAFATAGQKEFAADECQLKPARRTSLPF